MVLLVGSVSVTWLVARSLIESGGGVGSGGGGVRFPAGVSGLGSSTGDTAPEEWEAGRGRGTCGEGPRDRARASMGGEKIAQGKPKKQSHRALRDFQQSDFSHGVGTETGGVDGESAVAPFS